MQFISMDLISPIAPSSNGHHYALTVICMLTGYKLCIPFKTKAPSEVVQAYIDEVYTKNMGTHEDPVSQWHRISKSVVHRCSYLVRGGT